MIVTLISKNNIMLTGKFIQNRLIMSFLALLLIVKLIKVKFAFIIPFLFGAAVSKKIFLKILLFLVPAFAHVFKLCSAYYSSHTKSHHHHHHQVCLEPKNPPIFSKQNENHVNFLLRNH